jgi:hypothetical protein
MHVVWIGVTESGAPDSESGPGPCSEKAALKASLEAFGFGRDCPSLHQDNNNTVHGWAS